ncbi:hypothetical protein HNR46_002044 [Haloferula luteola]|uniref:Yip1 domain-containing protein n=1 Tax=Haloferula luteola TaxID=595692 RepID=A0A840V1D9_9BACT|nr:hypothetical protein [Haloferula luteola]MBB5351805.1 hypothetical protein [Haloferula luteola]
MTPTPPPPTEPESPPIGNSFRDLFEALLRRPRELAQDPMIDRPATLLRLFLLALVALLIFGFVLGTFAWHQQIWAAPLKLGGGMLFAAIICYPSLYIFSCLAGSSASAGRLAGILGGVLGLSGLLLLGFAPAVWIFTQGTRSFGFMGCLAVGSWLIGFIFAGRFLDQALHAHGASQKGPMAIWSIIFLLVTLQLTTSLRPILGTSDRFITPEKKFFLQHWSETFDLKLPPETPSEERS